MADKFCDMTDEQLKEILISCHSAIHIADCYSPKDLMYMKASMDELQERGYTIEEKRYLVIKEPDDAI